MILHREKDELLVILQTDHARLSGKLASAWGNDRVEPALPEDIVLYAAAHHDDGWFEWEARPQLDPESGQPYSFMTIPPRQHIDFYTRGVDLALREKGAYAALLILLHAMGLYESHLRAARSGDRESSDEDIATVEDHLESLREREAELRRKLREDPRSEEEKSGARIERNRQLISLFDGLSLYFCPGTFPIDRLGPYDLGAGGERLVFKIREGEGHSLIRPYPFRVEPLEVKVALRRLKDSRFEDTDDFLEAFNAAAVEMRTFELRGA